MIDYEYFVKGFTIRPLHTAADLSQTSLQTALIQLDFSLEDVDTKEYILHCSKGQLEFLSQTLSNNVFNINIKLFEVENPQSKYGDEWYLVDVEKKLIIYSPGA